MHPQKYIASTHGSNVLEDLHLMGGDYGDGGEGTTWLFGPLDVPGAGMHPVPSELFQGPFFDFAVEDLWETLCIPPEKRARSMHRLFPQKYDKPSEADDGKGAEQA